MTIALPSTDAHILHELLHEALAHALGDAWHWPEDSGFEAGSFHCAAEDEALMDSLVSRVMALPAEHPDQPLETALTQGLSHLLGDANPLSLFDCTRVWSAWGVGTMHEDDFCPLASDPDRLRDLVQAALLGFSHHAALKTAQGVTAALDDVAIAPTRKPRL